jgi:hypothetical protein
VRAGWLGIVLAAAMILGCSRETESDDGTFGAAPGQEGGSGTDGSTGQAGGGGGAGRTEAGGEGGEPDGGSGGAVTGGEGGAAGGASGEGGSAGQGGDAGDSSIPGDAGIPDGEVPDGEVPDGEVPDGTAGEGGASEDCGEIGLTCTEGSCGSGFLCELGVCVPSDRRGCGGFAGWTCDDAPYTECLYFDGSDYGVCLTVAELVCACEVARSAFNCST